MPNKYYLREDRKAVKPDEKKEPREKETGVNLILDIIHISWNEHLASLPALDVDPDYLKRLSPGWFEGEERYEILSPFDGSWIEVSKNRYDKEISHDRRLTIVAPQEAEKGKEGEAASEDKVDENGDPTHGECWCDTCKEQTNQALSNDGMVCVKCGITNPFGNCNEDQFAEYISRIIKRNGLRDKPSLDKYFSKQKESALQMFDELAQKKSPKTIPATPQPVTGEAVEFDTWLGKERDAFVVSILEAPWNTEQRVQAENILIAFDQARERLRSASRQSDAVGISMEKTKEIAVDFLWENKSLFREKDGYRTVEKVFDEWFNKNGYYQKTLNSKQPNPNK